LAGILDVTKDACIMAGLKAKARLLLQRLFALATNEPFPNRKPIPAAVWRHFVFDKNLIHGSLSLALFPKKFTSSVGTGAGVGAPGSGTPAREVQILSPLACATVAAATPTASPVFYMTSE